MLSEWSTGGPGCWVGCVDLLIWLKLVGEGRGEVMNLSSKLVCRRMFLLYRVYTRLELGARPVWTKSGSSPAPDPRGCPDKAISPRTQFGSQDNYLATQMWLQDSVACDLGCKTIYLLTWVARKFILRPWSQETCLATTVAR